MIIAGEAGAQNAVTGVPNALLGFSQNRDQPIKIEAATMGIRKKKKEATFTGNVNVVQGDTTMTSQKLVVFYGSTPGPGGKSSISRWQAGSNVVVTWKEQVVTGETAVFDVKNQRITVLGGVILTQGNIERRGDRLMVDMTTGVSRLETHSGHVKGRP